MTDRRFFERHGFSIVVTACVLMPCVGWAAIQALASNVNDIWDWMPAEYAETAEYRWFGRHFGQDEFVLITWEGCTLDDPRLELLTSRLAALECPPAGRPMFGRVVSGRSVLDQLMGEPTNQTYAAAVARLQGTLLGPDGRQPCVVVWMTDESRNDVHVALSAIRATLTDCGVPRTAVKMGGPPVVNAAIDEVSARTLNLLIPFTCAVGLVIAWSSIRSLRLTVLIQFTALYSMAASLAALWVCGVRMNGLLITMVPLVYVVSTSGAIHLCNYYRQCVRKHGERGAPGRALAHAMLPLGLASATTIAGLLSICYNELLPIRQFGLFSAVGAALSWLLLVVWVPSALTVFPEPRPDPAGVARQHDGEELVDTGEAPLSARWERVGETVIRRHTWTALGCLSVTIVCLLGLPRVNISIDVMQEFKANSAVIQDYVWLEEHVGPLVPMEVILRMNEAECPLSMLARARLVDRVQSRIDALEKVGGTLSAATFGPDVRRESGGLRDAVLNRRLRTHRDTLVETGYLATGEGEELWRISARVAALEQVDYGAFVEDLKIVVEDVLHAEPDGETRGVSVTYTGMAPVFFKARRSLVDGLIWGLTTDFVLLVVAITIAMRHWSSGMLLLLTSIFPTALVLGTAGWLGLTLDQGAVLAPCVALGVSVDDVIHFLIWFRWGIQHGQARPQAVWLAWHGCARPMYQSWALLGLGMSTLGVSAYVPIMHFGWTMVAMLTVGLVGNLFLLPALLAGPLGGVIARRCPRLQSPAPIIAGAD